MSFSLSVSLQIIIVEYYNLCNCFSKVETFLQQQAIKKQSKQEEQN